MDSHHGLLSNADAFDRRQNLLDAMRANEQEDDQGNGPASSPEIGILHRTIISSPVVKWIFPALIRSADQNDLVFIGENFLHIKELQPDGQLKHIATKLDFPSKIRSANVVGQRIEIDEPSLENGQSKSTANRRSSERKGPMMPPNLVVLALESADLMFIFAEVDSSTGRLRFNESVIPFQRTSSISEQPGCEISVHNSGMVVAVAAHFRNIVLYRLKDWQTMNDDYARDRHVIPVVKVRQIDLQGSVLSISFLTDNGKVDSLTLLAIVRTKKRTQLQCFRGRTMDEFSPYIPDFPLDPSAFYYLTLAKDSSTDVLQVANSPTSSYHSNSPLASFLFANLAFTFSAMSATLCPIRLQQQPSLTHLNKH
jgi:hypothetical protein